MLFPDNSTWMEPPALSHPEAEEFQKAGQGRAELTLFFIFSQNPPTEMPSQWKLIMCTLRPVGSLRLIGRSLALLQSVFFFFFFKMSLMGGKV